MTPPSYRPSPRAVVAGVLRPMLLACVLAGCSRGDMEVAAASDGASGATVKVIVSATASPDPVGPGQSSAITVSVQSAGTLDAVLVDVELDDANRNRVAQTRFSPVTLTGGATQTFTWGATAPSVPGTYAIDVGIFSTDLSKQYAWQSAGSLGVVAATVGVDGGVDGSPGAGGGFDAETTGGGGPDAADGGGATASGLHVVRGTGGAPGHLVDGSGRVVQLHGANRSGTEGACTYGQFPQGPVDQPSLDAMKTWHINAVRVPINEDCWLGINGIPAAYSGAPYQRALADWVGLITQNGMYAIIDLHWTAPGSSESTGQQPLPDADHAIELWSQVADSFKGNGSVLFDLFNEPYVSNWSCWVSGGACAQVNGTPYKAAGMAALLKAVRQAGASNVAMLGGLGYSGDLSQWVSSVNSMTGLAAPLDGIDIGNVVASWHAYDYNSEQSGCPGVYNGYGSAYTCNTAQATAQSANATTVLAAGFPLVIGEIGISAYDPKSAASFSSAQLGYLTSWLDDMLTWADRQGQGYLGWSWNTNTPPLLISDYSGTPSPYFGATYQAHVQSR